MTAVAAVSDRREPLTVCLDLSPQLGGLTRGILDLAAAVGGPIVSLDSRRRAVPQQLPGDGVQHLSVPGLRLRSATGRLPSGVERVLADAVDRASFVIVHSLYRPHLPAIARMCRVRRVPYWVVTHGMLDPWVTARHRLAKRAWLRWFGRPALRDAEVVLFSTSAERDKARPAYAGPNSVVVPWPVDVPDLHDRPAMRAALRTELGLPADGKVLLWLGRYDSLKRPEHVIEAFTRAAVSGWSLVMAGFPGDVPLDRIRAAAARSTGRIVVHGPAADEKKRLLLLGADAFVSLSWRENFGYAVAEALAAGLPVASSPDHDLLPDGVAGLFGVAGADHSLAAAITTIRGVCGLTREEQAAAGTRAREWAAKTLNRAAFSSRLAALVPTPLSSRDIHQDDAVPLGVKPA